METYVYKRRADGTHVINLRRTWEKLVLAARAVVAIENPADVFVISSRPFGQRAVLKFAAHTGATPIAGRFTPGAFTNQVTIRSNIKTMMYQFIYFSNFYSVYPSIYKVAVVCLCYLLFNVTLIKFHCLQWGLNKRTPLHDDKQTKEPLTALM